MQRVHVTLCGGHLHPQAVILHRPRSALVIDNGREDKRYAIQQQQPLTDNKPRELIELHISARNRSKLAELSFSHGRVFLERQTLFGSR